MRARGEARGVEVAAVVRSHALGAEQRVVQVPLQLAHAVGIGGVDDALERAFPRLRAGRQARAVGRRGERHARRGARAAAGAAARAAAARRGSLDEADLRLALVAPAVGRDRFQRMRAARQVGEAQPARVVRRAGLGVEQRGAVQVPLQLLDAVGVGRGRRTRNRAGAGREGRAVGRLGDRDHRVAAGGAAGATARRAARAPTGAAAARGSAEVQRDLRGGLRAVLRGRNRLERVRAGLARGAEGLAVVRRAGVGVQADVVEIERDVADAARVGRIRAAVHRAAHRRVVRRRGDGDAGRGLRAERCARAKRYNGKRDRSLLEAHGQPSLSWE